MDEPSVLEYLKSKLFPWKYPKIEVGEELSKEEASAEQASEAILPTLSDSDLGGEATIALESTRQAVLFPWRAMLSLLLTLAGQIFLMPPDRNPAAGIALYLLGIGMLLWAVWKHEWPTASIPKGFSQVDNLQARRIPFFTGLILAALAFLDFGGGQFTSLNLFLWISSLVSVTWALWLGRPVLEAWWQKLGRFIRNPRIRITLRPWGMLLAAGILLTVFFRSYQLSQVPPEMNSDHAEKLLDVMDVLKGQWNIFFPRNTGREPLQFYLTALIINIFGTGISFISLKLGTTLLGLASLPYYYLLGKEVGNRRVGLLAMILVGVAYWPNVLSRMGLRFILYPAFVAPALYYLVRGLRGSSRNDFILSGVALGIGLHGYTPIRVLPLVVVLAVGLFLIHGQSRGLRKQTLLHLATLAFISLLVFLPLLRFAFEEPDLFAYRSLTRMGSLERPLPGPAWLIFLSNLGKAMLMFAWDNGEVWPVSIPHWPALDIVTASLYYLGFVLVLVRYLHQRHWLDLFLLLSIPMLMLPSILSLAFPSENPILNRTAGAMVPVFLVIGLALDGLYSGLRASISTWGGKVAGVLAVGSLVALSALLNYDLVFNRYLEQYSLSAWNTSEMGRVIRAFASSSGYPDSAYIVAYPHWVDTRLVGIQAGFPQKDYAISIDRLADTQSDLRPMLFIINTKDQAAVDALHALFPSGWIQLYKSQVPTKDFLIFFVPARPKP